MEVQSWLVRRRNDYVDESMITPEVWRDWIAHEAEQRRAYEAKADIDINILPQVDKEAVREQWAQGYPRLFRLLAAEHEGWSR